MATLTDCILMPFDLWTIVDLHAHALCINMIPADQELSKCDQTKWPSNCTCFQGYHVMRNSSIPRLMWGPVVQWLVQPFRSERLRVRSRWSATFTPSAHVRRQSLSVWPSTLNKRPLPFFTIFDIIALCDIMVDREWPCMDQCRPKLTCTKLPCSDRSWASMASHDAGVLNTVIILKRTPAFFGLGKRTSFERENDRGTRFGCENQTKKHELASEANSFFSFFLVCTFIAGRPTCHSLSFLLFQVPALAPF